MNRRMFGIVYHGSGISACENFKFLANFMRGIFAICMVYRRDHKMFGYRDGKFSDHSMSFSCSQTNFRRFRLVSWQNCVLLILAGSELKVENASLPAAISFFTTHQNIICSVAPEVCRSFRDFIMPNLASNNWNWCFSIQQAETVSTTILCCLQFIDITSEEITIYVCDLIFIFLVSNKIRNYEQRDWYAFYGSIKTLFARFLHP